MENTRNKKDDLHEIERQQNMIGNIGNPKYSRTNGKTIFVEQEKDKETEKLKNALESNMMTERLVTNKWFTKLVKKSQINMKHQDLNLLKGFGFSKLGKRSMNNENPKIQITSHKLNN